MTKELTSKNRRILIVDDDPRVQDDYRHILVPERLTKEEEELNVCMEELFNDTAIAAGLLDDGEALNPDKIVFEIESAFQGEEGVEKAKKAKEAGVPFALAFVDMRMPPGINGVETIEKIWEVDPDIQCIICSAYSDQNMQNTYNRLMKHEQFLFLRKPFDISEVKQLGIAMTEKWNTMNLYRNNRRQLDHMLIELSNDLAQLEESENAKRILSESKRRLKQGVTKMGSLWDRFHGKIAPEDYRDAEKIWDDMYMELSGIETMLDGKKHVLSDSVNELWDEDLDSLVP